jgi:hypothetical protein
MKKIILPPHLLLPIYVSGLREPLEAVAEILDEQGKGIYADALRDAATICEAFAEISLEKTASLFS